MIYRLKAQTVEARQVVAQDWAGCEETAAWCGGDLVHHETYLATPDWAVIFLPDGRNEVSQFACDGDWIVRLAGGTYAVYPPERFAASFEPVVQL